jgi:hypothetical protein
MAMFFEFCGFCFFCFPALGCYTKSEWSPRVATAATSQESASAAAIAAGPVLIVTSWFAAVANTLRRVWSKWASSILTSASSFVSW